MLYTYTGYMFTSSDDIDDIVDCDEDLTTRTSQSTPRTVTITEILNAVIKGLESAVAR